MNPIPEAELCQTEYEGWSNQATWGVWMAITNHQHTWDLLLKSLHRVKDGRNTPEGFVSALKTLLHILSYKNQDLYAYLKGPNHRPRNSINYAELANEVAMSMADQGLLSGEELERVVS